MVPAEGPNLDSEGVVIRGACHGGFRGTGGRSSRGVPKLRSRPMACSFLNRTADSPVARKATGPCEVHLRHEAQFHMPLGGRPAGTHPGRRGQRGQERDGDGRVDGLPAHAHVPGAAPVDQLGGALAVVVRHAFGRAGVEDGELAAVRAAGGQALQQRAAFPDRAGARLAGLRPGVAADAGLVGLVGVPVDEPGVVIGDEDLGPTGCPPTTSRPLRPCCRCLTGSSALR